MYCSGCGQAVADDAKFCARCGRAVAPAAAAPAAPDGEAPPPDDGPLADWPERAGPRGCAPTLLLLVGIAGALFGVALALTGLAGPGGIQPVSAGGGAAALAVSVGLCVAGVRLGAACPFCARWGARVEANRTRLEATLREAARGWHLYRCRACDRRWRAADTGDTAGGTW